MIDEIREVLMLLIVASGFTVIMIILLSKSASTLGLLDYPDDRKRHSGHIPLVGGLAFFVASFFALAYAYGNEPIIAGYLLAVTLITLMGAVDDSKHLSVYVRLFVQMLAALLLVFSSGHSIEQFFTMFFGSPVKISFIAGAVLTVFAVMGAINAFNMVDGVDGLAGLQALNTFLAIAILFWFSQQLQWVLWPLLICSCLVVFLLFNFRFFKALPKVFMGDAGAMFIGFSIIYLLVIGSQSEVPAFKTVTALWIIAIPLTDMAAIILQRIWNGNSAFAADRQHLHHLLLRLGFSAKQSVSLLTVAAFTYSAIGLMGEYYYWPDYLMFYGFLINFIMHIVLRYVLIAYAHRFLNHYQ